MFKSTLKRYGHCSFWTHANVRWWTESTTPDDMEESKGRENNYNNFDAYAILLI